jgi:putative spermidine/putrescine transport system substrate-binding protein
LPALALALVACGGGGAFADERALTVVSWGGAYTRSQILGFVRDFERETGVEVDMIDYAGGVDEIRSQVRAHNVKWDVVDVEIADALLACREGLLVEIDHETLPPAPDGTPAAEDFVDGALTPCGVGNVAASTIVAWDRERLSEPPRSLEDFFDTRRFPGPRGLRRTPQTNLEWALLADGVSPARVYALLATEEGLDRAFRVLDRIKPYVRWWVEAEEAVRLLETGQVSMTSAYNGRIASAVERGEHFGILWDHHVRYADAWVIPRHTERLTLALEFVRYATSTDALAAQARLIPYGPLRRSSIAVLGADVRAGLPTAPRNLAQGFEADPLWWAEHLPLLRARFERWLERPVMVPKDWPAR